MPDLGNAGRGGGGQHRRFRAGHRRFLEIDRGGTEAIGSLELMDIAPHLSRPHRPQRLQVRRDRASCREVATRRGETGPAEPSEKRTKQQDRPAEPADKTRVGLRRGDLFAADINGRRADALHVGAESLQQLGHDPHVSNARHVGQPARLIGEQTGGQQGQRRVLVPFDIDAAGQRVSTLHHQRRRPGHPFCHFTALCPPRPTRTHQDRRSRPGG